MSKIGNRPPVGPPLLQELPPVPKTSEQKSSPAPSDGFERGAPQPPAPSAPKTRGLEAPPPGVSGDKDPKFNEMLKQTRSDPRALSALAHTLSMAFNRFNADFGNDKAKATLVLDELAKQKFSQGALDTVRSELASLRERMNITRHRMATQKRRLRALTQLAGRLADSKLADEIAGIEARLELIDTAWAESFVGLGLGKVVYQPQDEEAPEHLRHVLKTQITGTKRNADAAEVGELLSDVHPARLVTQIAAREIDGTQKKVSAEVMRRVRKEQGAQHGRTTQAIAALYELFESENE